MVASTPTESGLRQRFNRRIKQWIKRRIPASRSVTLDQRRLFIFPTKVGLFFIACTLVMLLAAINFQNNLSYALTFLLFTLFIIAVLHTFANLSGLTIRAVKAQPAFPGQQSRFDFVVERTRKRDHFGVHFRFDDSLPQTLNLIDANEQRLQLHVPVGKRGWCNPGRVLVESTYPLGLLRCWSWIDLDLSALVYPAPQAGAPLTGAATQSPDGASILVEGSDDFYGFRSYRLGDSARHIHWKGLAREQALQTKYYAAFAEHSVWLDWDMLDGFGVEQRLSQLCYWALELDRKDDEYGLRLPGVEISPACGERHRDAVLKALALYGIAGREE